MLCAIAPLWAGAADAIFFSRSFPGSGPAYFEVLVDSEGKATYREAPGEEDPLTFTLNEDEREWLFEKAREADHFNRKLASKRKVAFTGDKVLRYESDGAPKGEAAFAYTEDPAATEIVSFFVRIAETEQYFIALERAVHFDRLGVNDALLNLHGAYGKGRVVAAEQFLPMLEKIVADQKIMHVARARASAMIESITAPPAE